MVGAEDTGEHGSPKPRQSNHEKGEQEIDEAGVEMHAWYSVPHQGSILWNGISQDFFQLTVFLWAKGVKKLHFYKC